MKTSISNNVDTLAVVSGEWTAEETQTSQMLVRSYHEMADRPLVETDILTDFKANLHLLQDMQSRMAFMMKEVRYILKANG